ncbi:hypothetical protein P3W24_17550 [Luteibacter sp. PPL201]|jgi:hypothetical protein|uniref:Uncharacterized protein n=1 Tax=Luteibacter sahnii TaxID=3021977 RepID=A0ABT6BF93_9GAMM|nr:hypothetical protein [Luteibacter sp. PPL193]MDY1549146.1 hypothetical protein [Luteibacter sp. PPL193]
MTNKPSRSTRLTLSVMSPLLVAMTGAFGTASAADVTPAPAPTVEVAQTAITPADLAAAVAQPLDEVAVAVKEPVKCTFYDNGGTHCSFYSSGSAGSGFADTSMAEFNV